MKTHLALSAVLAAGSAPGWAAEAGFVWEADDRTMSLTVPAQMDEELADVLADPGRLQDPFLEMIGADGAEAKVSGNGLYVEVSSEVFTEEVTADDEACKRRVERRSEAEFDPTGLLILYDSEERGEAFSVADGRSCGLLPEAMSAATYIPGTWRPLGEDSGSGGDEQESGSR